MILLQGIGTKEYRVYLNCLSICSCDNITRSHASCTYHVLTSSNNKMDLFGNNKLISQLIKNLITWKEVVIDLMFYLDTKRFNFSNGFGCTKNCSCPSHVIFHCFNVAAGSCFKVVATTIGKEKGERRKLLSHLC